MMKDAISWLDFINPGREIKKPMPLHMVRKIFHRTMPTFDGGTDADSALTLLGSISTHLGMLRIS